MQDGQQKQMEQMMDTTGQVGLEIGHMQTDNME